LALPRQRGKMLAHLKNFFEKKKRLWSIIFGFALVAIIGYIDTLTGREISYAVFYLIAICYITWFAGILPGILASIASALICFFDEYTGARVSEHPIFPYWNAGGMLGIYLIVLYLLSELKEILKVREKNCRNMSSDGGKDPQEPSDNGKSPEKKIKP